MINFDELTPEQKLENDIIAMGHSVDAIFKAVEICTHTEEEHSLIERNVAHLAIMLSKPKVEAHLSNKSSFLSAITLGKEHLA